MGQRGDVGVPSCSWKHSQNVHFPPQDLIGPPMFCSCMITQFLCSVLPSAHQSSSFLLSCLCRQNKVFSDIQLEDSIYKLASSSKLFLMRTRVMDLFLALGTSKLSPFNNFSQSLRNGIDTWRKHFRCFLSTEKNRKNKQIGSIFLYWSRNAPKTIIAQRYVYHPDMCIDMGKHMWVNTHP